MNNTENMIIKIAYFGGGQTTIKQALTDIDAFLAEATKVGSTMVKWRNGVAVLQVQYIQPRFSDIDTALIQQAGEYCND